MIQNQLQIVLAIPDKLLEGTVEETVLRGTIIIGPKQPSDFLYIIASGHVRLYSLDTKDQKVVHAFYGHGEYFPLGQAIAGNPSGIYFQAITEVVVRKIPMNDFRAVLDTDIELCRSVLNYVFDQTAQYKYQVDNLTYKFASERIAYRLLLMAGRTGEYTGRGYVLPSFSQKDFADTIGMSREIVSKGFKKLERHGVITHDGERMTIHKPEQLLGELKGKNNLPEFFYELKNN